MPIDYENLFTDYDVPHWVEGKNVTQGWVNVCCPHRECDDSTNHGGFNPETGHYNCWKCGWHPSQEIIALLLNTSTKNAKNIMLKYTTSSRAASENKIQEHTSKDRQLRMPLSFKKPSRVHREYLKRRNYDADAVIDEFHLLGTEHIGEYKFRIIAPIFFYGKLVSYQGRDITGKAELRYKACKMKDEIVHHKDIFYNFDSIDESGVLVEGITDVWRLGKGSFASFGTGVTTKQVQLLKRKAREGKFKKLYILLDEGSVERKKAEMLASEMLMLKHFEVYIISNYGGDPGDMKQKDANALMKKLGLIGWNK